MTFTLPTRYKYVTLRAAGVIKYFMFMVFASPRAERSDEAVRPYPDVRGMEHLFTPKQGTQEDVPTSLLGLLGKITWHLGERYKFHLLGLAAVSLIAYDLSCRPWRNIGSRILDWANNRYILHASTVRSSFNQTRTHEVNKPQNHPHPTAAATRSAAVNTIRHMIANLGKISYSIQTSSRDDRDNIDGSRDYYWGKDLHIKARQDLLTSDHIPYLIDVDYYLDMNEFLAKAKRTTYLYTLQPSRAASVHNKDYSYKWAADQTVVYTVSGSGYSHQVWNYQYDSIGANDFTSWFFWRWNCTAYAIEKRNIDEDHEIVCLTPTGTWYGIFAILAKWLVTFRELPRMTPVVGDIVTIERRTEDGHLVSIGAVNSYAEALVPVDVMDTATTLNQVNAVGMGVAAAKSLINSYAEKQNYSKETTDKTAAAMVKYVKAGSPPRTTTVFPREHAVRRYQFGQFDPEAKPGMTPFMTPLVHEAFVPDVTPGNEVKQTYGRIERFQSKEKTRPAPHWLLKIVDDFVGAIVPEPHTLHPVDRDEVWARQARPSQRQILKQADYGDPTDTNAPLESFTKKESYAKPGDPRAITTDRPAHKALYSQYVYALSNEICQMEWYAFGRTPLEVATKVANICSRAHKDAGVSDFSRFDGHVDEVARVLELRLMTRAFDACYTDEIVELHGATYQRKAVGRMGTMYNTGYSRASGMPDTSLGNTVLNAFVAYLSVRMDHGQGGEFRSHTEAVQFLETKCIFGGDDGLVADPYDTWIKAAEIVNQDLDLVKIPVGELGVTFLSRYYGPDVWFGDTNSCIDVPRQLKKLHVTPHLPSNIEPLDKFAEKVRSLLLTDPETPILGEIAASFTKYLNVDLVLKSKADDLFPMRRWDSQYDITVQYPNFRADWMFKIIDDELIDFDYPKFNAWLKASERPGCAGNYLTPPLCVEPVAPQVKDSVFVDDDYVKVEGSNPEQRAAVPRTKPLGLADLNPPILPASVFKPFVATEKKPDPIHPGKPPSTSKEGQDNRQKKPKKVKTKEAEKVDVKTKPRPVIEVKPKQVLEEKSEEPAPKAQGASKSAPKLGGKPGAGGGSKTKA